MDYLALLDDYEAEAYDDIYTLQICQHYDCRDPRNGPWVSVRTPADGPEIMCIRCFRVYVVGEDPMDVYE